MKKLIILSICTSLILITSINGHSQAILGLSAGGGAGKLSQKFTDSGNPVTFSHSAPGAYLGAELVWGHFYIDMSLALLLPSENIKLGDTKVDVSDYSAKLSMDFTAVGLGYLYPVSDKLEVGGAIGFHVAAPTLTPNDEDDLTKLRFGGYYGLIGLNAVPRIRYSINDSFKLTLSLPLGMDFGPMSDDVVVGGMSVGESPAIVQPESLNPLFKGSTYGIYLSVGYFFQLNR